MSIESLKQYIDKWDKEDLPKLENDKDFISDFVQFARESTFDHWEFLGVNGYCGYTALLHEFSAYGGNYALGLIFEFAYSDEFVKVFTGKNNGFWVPEYIDLDGTDATELTDIVREKLNGWAGLPITNKE